MCPQSTMLGINQMTAPAFQTNYEGGVTLEQLAESTGCSLEQFLGDSVLSVLVCVRVAEENRLAGKSSPTLLLFEHETGQGYETYDFIEVLTSQSVPKQRTDQPLPVADPFAEDLSKIDLPLSKATQEELEELSQVLAVPPRKILEESINLRWLLKQAADQSLEVLIEATEEDEYIVVPTTFTD